MLKIQEKQSLYRRVLENTNSPESLALINSTAKKIQEGRQNRQEWLANGITPNIYKKAERNGVLIQLEQQGFIIPQIRNCSNLVTWDHKNYHLANALSSSKTSDALYIIDRFGKVILPVKDRFLEYAPTVNFGGTFGAFVGDPDNCNNMYIPIVGGEVAEQDPYGTQSSDSVVSVNIEGITYYLGSHHPGYGTTLVRLTDFCNKGCSYCYFGVEARLKEPNIISDTKEKLGYLNPVDQVRMLGDLYRKNPEMQTKDVLFSGGEPMDLDTKTWQGILQEVATWDWLDTFRVCTGALFLGSSQSISSEIIDLIAQYQDQTGVRVCFNCNVAHSEQMLRLETIVKHREMSDKIKDLTIYPQVPVTQNNFDIHNLDSAWNNMLEMCKITSNLYGGQVYKFICDMQGSIPKILFILVASKFDRHQIISNIAKPIACEIFSDSGNSSNLTVNFNTLFNIRANGGFKITSLDGLNNMVEYFVTHANDTVQKFSDIIPKSINITELLRINQ